MCTFPGNVLNNYLCGTLARVLYFSRAGEIDACVSCFSIELFSHSLSLSDDSA